MEQRNSAIFYLVISGLFFAIVHAGVKLLSRLPAYEIVFARSVISSLLSFGALRMAHINPWGKNKRMLIIRGLTGTMALLLYFYTLQSMPLASAVTIQYLHPIFTVILAGLFMDEKPTWMQWVLFTASFAGVLLVRGWDPRIHGFDLTLGVCSALFSAVAYNMIRALRHEDHALVVVFYLPLVSVVTVGPYALSHWMPPLPWEWIGIAVVGAFTQVAQYFMTKAYQADRVSNISNLNYLGIVYALAIGVLFFGETIEPLSLVGMGVIIVSALLSTHRKVRS